MRGLRKYLTPFAPDQSGAVSVLYELGGLVVICDAGGCTGNICGFDEPRWHTMRSAVFSAGLRDMDAIMGRDKKLVAELVAAARKLTPAFAAIVGTPVPAVIGTDYTALGRMARRSLTIPVLTLDTNGMQLYDKGAEKAYLALMRTFAKESFPVKKGTVGVLGVNPLDMSSLEAAREMTEVLLSEGAANVRCYGMGGSLEDIVRASEAEKTIVAAPSGLKAAQYLKETFGTPYEIRDPLSVRRLTCAWQAKGRCGGAASPADTACCPDKIGTALTPEATARTSITGSLAGKRILVTDQAVRADSLRRLLKERGAKTVTVASWFMPCRPCTAEGDVRLREEDDFTALAETYDVLVGDPILKQLVPGFTGEFVPIASFPVSGKLIKPGCLAI